MRHARLTVILLLAFVLSIAPVLMPPRAPGFGATVATAAQDPSAVEAALGRVWSARFAHATNDWDSVSQR